MTLPTCKLCKAQGLPGSKFCGACGTPYVEGDRIAAEREAQAARAAQAAFPEPPSQEDDLDDLFSSLPSAPLESHLEFKAPAAAPGEATNLFHAATGEPGAESFDDLDQLFSSPSEAPAGPGPSAGESDDLSSLFSSAPIAPRPRPTEPGMVTSILTGPVEGSEGHDPGSMEDSNLFGSSIQAMDPDSLFQATGKTGKMPAISAASTGSGDLDSLFDDLAGPGTTGQSGGDFDLFADTPEAPPPADPDDLFQDPLPPASGQEVPLSSSFIASPGADPTSDLDALFQSPETAPSGGASGGIPSGVDDLFASIPDLETSGVAETPFQPTVAEPSFESFETEEPSLESFEADVFSDTALDPLDPNFDANASMEIKAPLAAVPPPQAQRDSLEDLFQAEDNAVFEEDPTNLDLGPAPPLPVDDFANPAYAHLASAEHAGAPPEMPNLEEADILATAHAVADGVPDSDFELPSTEIPDPLPDDGMVHRPARDRRTRRRSSFTPSPPKVGLLGWGGALGGLFCASAFLAHALRHHPSAGDLGVGLFATCLTVVGLLTHVISLSVLKKPFPLEAQSRIFLLVGVGFLATSVPAASHQPWEPGLAMAVCLLLGVGHCIDNSRLALSVRYTFASVGVYSGLTLIQGLAIQSPIAYERLVQLRTIQAPGLAQKVGAGTAAKLLQAFDPLFVAVNFFLPAVALACLFELFFLAKQRWWSLVLIRATTLAVVGFAVFWNFRLYQKLNVPTLFTLIGMG